MIEGIKDDISEIKYNMNCIADKLDKVVVKVTKNELKINILYYLLGAVSTAVIGLLFKLFFGL